MTPEQERWGVALHIVRREGDQALSYVAERIASLEAVGEDGGVRLWREIETRVKAIGEADGRRQ